MNLENRRGFTLLELLVVIGIIALLTGLIVPAVTGVRSRMTTLSCLNNMRNFGVAHQMYMQDNRGRFIDVGFAHGGEHQDEEVAWINTLESYYGSNLLHKSPADKSPHWPLDQGGAGLPVPPTGDVFRRTSYGVNNFLVASAPADPVNIYDRRNKVRDTANTVHFLIMAEEGEFAGADHPHVENWFAPGNPDSPPILASNQIATGMHGGPEGTWDAVSNYGFLDGHVETLKFSRVYLSPERNLFDPAVSFGFALDRAMAENGG